MATILDCLSQSDCNAVSTPLSYSDIPINANFENLLISPEGFCQLKNCITCSDISDIITQLQNYNFQLISDDYLNKFVELVDDYRNLNNYMGECNSPNIVLCKAINDNYKCITALSINGNLTEDFCDPSADLRECLGIECFNCPSDYSFTLDLTQVDTSKITSPIFVLFRYKTCINGKVDDDLTDAEFTCDTPFDEQFPLGSNKILPGSNISIKYSYNYDNTTVVTNTTTQLNDCKNFDINILPEQ